MRRGALIVVLLLIVGGGGYVAGSRHLLAPRPALAGAQAMTAADCYTFPETGKTVCGRFLDYWQQHGGLAQQGLPLTNTFTEVSSVDGKAYTVQYFERAVFEAHPEQAPPYDVLLTLLGREKFLTKYPGGDPSVNPPPSPSPPPSGDIIGQTIDFSGAFGDGTLRGTVTDFRRHLSLSFNGKPLVPQGEFVAVFMRVTNTGSKPTSVGAYSFVLADNQQRQFSMANIEAQLGARDQFHVATLYTTIQPSLALDSVFIFDIAMDGTAFRVVPGQR